MDEATAEMIERALDQMTKEELNELTKHAYRRLVDHLGAPAPSSRGHPAALPPRVVLLPWPS